MCESAVAPEVAVVDAEPESEHIEVGNHGASCADHPDSLWRAWAVEAGANANGGYGM
jgi:hypothetical protein